MAHLLPLVFGSLIFTPLTCRLLFLPFPAPIVRRIVRQRRDKARGWGLQPSPALHGLPGASSESPWPGLS